MHDSFWHELEAVKTAIEWSLSQPYWKLTRPAIFVVG